MPPKAKKTVEDPADKPPEGDNERLVTITISGVYTAKPQRPESAGASNELVAPPPQQAKTTPRGKAGGADKQAASQQDQPAFSPTLRSPSFTLAVPSDGAAAAETLRVEAPGPIAEPEFTHHLLNRKIAINPKCVDSFLAGDFVFQALSLAEPKPGAEPVPPPVAKGAKGGKKNQSKGDGGSTARSEASGEDVLTHLSHTFGLSNVLTDANVDVIELVNDAAEYDPTETTPNAKLMGSRKLAPAPPSVNTTENMQPVIPKTPELGTDGVPLPPTSPFKPAEPPGPRTVRKMATRSRLHLRHVPGFEKLELVITCSDPLLSPNNVAKYRPVVVEVIGAHNLPPITPLELKHNLDGTALMDTHRQSKLPDRFKGVCVRYSFMGRNVETPRVEHAPNVNFRHKRVFFLQSVPKLHQAQRLFFKGITFELRDRDAVDTNIGEFFGTTHVGLRNSLDGEVRFVSNTQVVGGRVEAAVTPTDTEVAPVLYGADYLSYATTVQTKVNFLYPAPCVKFVKDAAKPPPLPEPVEEVPASTKARRKSSMAGAARRRSTSPVDKRRPSRSTSPAQSDRRTSGPTSPSGSRTGTPSTLPPVLSEAALTESAAGRSASPLLGATGSVFSVGAKPFLSRVALVMPYSGGLTKQLIQAVLGTVVQYTRAGFGSEVTEVPIERPKPPQDVLDAITAERGGTPGASDKKGGKVSAKERAALAAAAEAAAAAAAAAADAVPLPNVVQMHTPDAISGFELMDGVSRIIVIEGRAAVIQRIVEVAVSVSGGDESALRVLHNTQLQFPMRYYHKYPPLVVKLTRPSDRKRAEQAAKEAAEAAAAAAAAEKPSGKGKGNKDVPPIKPPVPVAEEAAPEIETTLDEPDENFEKVDVSKVELDAGGVGARIRRIRINTPLSQLRDAQSNFMRRRMNKECLAAIRKLCDLRVSTTMLNAVDHDHFPTTRELIALERANGQTLEVFDVCASDIFYSFASTSVDEVVANAVAERASPKRMVSDDTVDLANLGRSVGRVTSFVAIPSTSVQTKGLPSVKKLHPRYQHKTYMYVPHMDFSICCVFPSEPPHQLLRYTVTAQIVENDGIAIPFAMSWDPVMKKGSDNRNPTFVAKKRAEMKRAPPSEYFRLKAQREGEYRRTHRLAETERPYQDYSSDDEDGFKDGPPETATRGEFHYDAEVTEITENKVELNKMRAGETKRLAHAQGDVKRAAVLSAEEIDEVRALYHNEGRRKVRLEERLAVSKTGMAGLPSFSTVDKRTASDDRLRGPTVDGPRVDDLKQPWVEPSVAYKGIKTGPNPMRVELRNQNILGDPKRMKSIFQSDSAVNQRLEEEADRQLDIDQWRSKVVVEDINFRVKCRVPRDKTSNQLDKLGSVLDGEPKKISIKKSFAPPPPASIRLAEQEVPKPFVSPKVHSHPEKRTFYYGKPHDKLPVKGAPISTEERRSPLYGGKGYEGVSFKKPAGN